MKLRKTKEYIECSKVVRWYKSLSKKCNELDALLGIDYDSPLLRVIWFMFSSYVEAVQELIHDKQERLSWFLWDNNCGKATNNDRRVDGRRITTVDQLAKMIIEDKKRHTP